MQQMLSGFSQFPCAAIILSIRGPHSTEVYLIFYKFPYVHIFVVIAYFTFLVHNCFLLGCKLYTNIMFTINTNSPRVFGVANVTCFSTGTAFSRVFNPSH